MFTQTNDDNITQEIQTDDLKTETRWCQHTHDVKTCGGKFSVLILVEVISFFYNIYDNVFAKVLF